MQGYQSDDGQSLTPFSAAAYYGQPDVLKMLIEKFKPNIEQECPVSYDRVLVEGATALWCAAGAGEFHLKILLAIFVTEIPGIL